MTVFLALVVVIVKQSDLSSERFSGNVAIEGVYNLDQSIQASFKDIFTLNSGISVSKIENNVTFSEILPNVKSTNFKNNITKFNDFLESNYSITFNELDLNNNLPLIVKPNGIIFTHPIYGGSILEVFYQNNFDGFIVSITSSKVLDAGSCSGSGSGSILNINAVGSTGSCSANGVNSMELFESGTAIRLGTLNLDSVNNILTITSEDSLIISVKAYGLDDNGDDITVTTQENILNYNFEDFNFVKNGTIRIL